MGKQPDDSLSFPTCGFIPGLHILSVFNCSLSESAQEIQGVGVGDSAGGGLKETEADILLHFPLTAELSSWCLATNIDVQIKISQRFVSPRWNSWQKHFKNKIAF